MYGEVVDMSCGRGMFTLFSHLRFSASAECAASTSTAVISSQFRLIVSVSNSNRNRIISSHLSIVCMYASNPSVTSDLGLLAVCGA